MVIHACIKMTARITNIAHCIAQVTLQLAHDALLVDQLWFGLTLLEVVANFPTDKYGVVRGLYENVQFFDQFCSPFQPFLGVSSFEIRDRSRRI